MKTVPAAFIFDLDGTLVASGQDIASAANVVRRHFDLPDLPLSVVTGYVGDGVHRLLERTLAHGGTLGGGEGSVSAAMLDEAHRVFADHYGVHLLDTTRPYSDVAEVLAALAAVPLHVATNKPRRFADAILGGTGLAGLFRRVVGGDEAPARKPDPAHLRACLDGLDVDAGRVVVVGDSPNDIAAARSLGAVAVGCTYGLVAPQRVQAAAPDHVISAFRELAGLFPSRALP